MTAEPHPPERRKLLTLGALFVATLVATALIAGMLLRPKPAAPTEPEGAMPAAAWVALFHEGVNALEQHRFPEAADMFGDLVKDRPTAVNAWINLAAAELNRNTEATHAPCIAACGRAIELDGRRPEPWFLRGVLMKHLGRAEEAERDFKAALERAPEDPTALYFLATLIGDRDPEKAIALLDRALEGETHLASAHYAIAGFRRRTGNDDGGRALAVFKAFTESQTGSLVRIVYTELGRLGEAVRTPDVTLPRIDAPASGTALATATEIPGVLRAAAFFRRDGTPRVLVSRGAELVAIDATETSPRESVVATIDGNPSGLIPADADNDGDTDLLAVVDGALRYLSGDGTRFSAADFPNSPGTTFVAATWTDIDQDSDLDVVALTESSGLRVFLNRRDAVFTPVLPDSALVGTFVPPALPALPAGARHVMAADLDGDGDGDLLVTGSFGLRLLRNDRLLRFVDATTRANATTLGGIRQAAVSDLNGDGRQDIAWLTDDGAMGAHLHTRSGPFRLTFNPVTPKRTSGPATVSAFRLADVDLDGEDDLLLATEAGATALVPRGSGWIADVPGRGGAPVLVADAPGAASVASVLLAAPLGDGPGVSWIAGVGASVRLLAPPKTDNRGLGVRLTGRLEPGQTRANTGGVGARVEVTAGGTTRVREMRTNDAGPGAALVPLVFGMGGVGQADYVRITWPDDVLQNEGPVPGNQVKTFEEFQRKGSSCPILFVWDGERFACITDFLGTGGLGFWVAPDTFAPPDPTELVVVPPPVVPKDGRYEFRIHEPFEEACWIDKAKLLVVDHPEGTEVLPDERMAISGKAPDGTLFLVGPRMFPVAATDGRGRDVLKEVGTIDRRYAAAVPDPRFLGYAEPTTFTFDFGAPLREAAGTTDVVMALDGWVEYPYSHINVAAWQAGVRLEAMSVDVETADGSWAVLHTEAGYPAGLPRTMTLPLGTLPTALTGRLRLRTNQEAYVDRLTLFRPMPSTAMTVRTQDAAWAELRFSGYPREYSPDGRAPRLYDYQIRDPQFPFKTLAGTFTRFGDVRELLTDVDDRSVVFGGGEEIALAFDVPDGPSKGATRTVILDTYGWCKDMDPHTAHPATLEPLPFVGMTEYPYPPEAAPGETEAVREYKRKWQTRVLPGTRAPR